MYPVRLANELPDIGGIDENFKELSFCAIQSQLKVVAG